MEDNGHYSHIEVGSASNFVSFIVGCMHDTNSSLVTTTWRSVQTHSLNHLMMHMLIRRYHAHVLYLGDMMVPVFTFFAKKWELAGVAIDSVPRYSLRKERYG